MKKHPTALLLSVLAILLLLPLPAFAHGGHTDGNGGHTDHSTGDYHYRHGFEAHDHYDMDGDGTLDCPYDFLDRTGQNSWDSISSGDTNQNGITSEDSSYNYRSFESRTSPSSTEKEVNKMPLWVYWVFAVQTVLIIALLISNSFKKDAIQTIEARQKRELDAVNLACATRIAEKNATDTEMDAIRSYIADARKMNKALRDEQNDLLDEISMLNREILKLRRVRCFAKAAPLDISFSEDGEPVYWKPDIRKPYGDYTVFVSQKAKIYHTDYFCSGYSSKETHIFRVIDRCRPCQKCAAHFFDFSEAPGWYTGKDEPAEEYPDHLMINWRN